MTTRTYGLWTIHMIDGTSIDVYANCHKVSEVVDFLPKKLLFEDNTIWLLVDDKLINTKAIAWIGR